MRRWIRRNPGWSVLALSAFIILLANVLVWTHKPSSRHSSVATPSPAACDQLRVTTKGPNKAHTATIYKFEVSLSVSDNYKPRYLYWIFGQSDGSGDVRTGPETTAIVHIYPPGMYQAIVLAHVADAQGQAVLPLPTCRQTLVVR